MYACSPKWKDDWINLGDAERVLAQLSKSFGKYYSGFGVGVNSGLRYLLAESETEAG